MPGLRYCPWASAAGSASEGHPDCPNTALRLVSKTPVSSRCLPWVYESQTEKRDQPSAPVFCPGPAHAWPGLCLVNPAGCPAVMGEPGCPLGLRACWGSPCCSSRLCSGLLLVSSPEPFLHLGGQRAEQVLFHDQATALQQWALAQLHRQAFQPVAPKLNLRQVGQLTHSRGQRLQYIIAQVQSPQLPTLEELWGERLDLQEGTKS